MVGKYVGKYGGKIWWGSMVWKYGEEVWLENMVGKYGEEVWWEVWLKLCNYVTFIDAIIRTRLESQCHPFPYAGFFIQQQAVRKG